MDVYTKFDSYNPPVQLFHTSAVELFPSGPANRAD